ncbi:MAG: hypothetical protein JKY42_11135 [Flavobacteriales bacterium]|nr:hypothetical protein [Flavobacteriales bacterium]
MRNPNILIFLFFFISVSTAVFAQEVEVPKAITYGISINGGVNSTSSIGESVSPSYGLGVLTKISTAEKFFHTIRLDYNIKQEKFANLTHYRWVDGLLTQATADIYKNYGIINLNYSFNYYLIQNTSVSLFSSIGIGINDLFWLKTRIDIPNSEEEITNGKTQFLYTNPLSRPTFNVGVGLLLPYEEDKLIAFKPEINYDYRLPFAKNTYPNFLTYSLRILLFF